MVHIVFSHAIEQLLKQAFMMKSNPFSGDVLSYEPQLELGDPVDTRKRQKRWADVYGYEVDESHIDVLEHAAERRLARVSKSISEYDQVVFWVGETTAEELAFLQLISNLERSDIQLKLNRYRDGLRLGDLLPSRMGKVCRPKLISEGDLTRFQNTWNEICQQGDQLRVREADFCFRFLDYAYFDEQILRLIPENEQIMLAVVVGEMHGYEKEIPYFFFVWRVRKLQEAGLIEWLDHDIGLKHTYIKRKEGLS